MLAQYSNGIEIAINGIIQKDLKNTFIGLLSNKNLLNVYCVSETILGSENTEKWNGEVPILKRSIF